MPSRYCCTKGPEICLNSVGHFALAFWCIMLWVCSVFWFKSLEFRFSKLYLYQQGLETLIFSKGSWDSRVIGPTAENTQKQVRVDNWNFFVPTCFLQNGNDTSEFRGGDKEHPVLQRNARARSVKLHMGLPQAVPALHFPAVPFASHEFLS